jgi:glyoxylase-like metal-dependent hydrolase (beta-lactamase superfamily II)
MRVNSLIPDLAYVRHVMVNVYFYGRPGAGDRQWVLIDAGLPGSAAAIASAAADRFGPDARPAAIVLTHGHFDHVGAARTLAERWDAPIYAHEREVPYVTGRLAYLPPEPAVGGGAMALLSPLYPRGPFHLGERVQPLRQDGAVPGMDGWRWIPTPGHSPGHISLFRESDRTLIAGDAFVTTKQESALAVLTQRPELHGPPAYFTPDWPDAWSSVSRLAELEPELAATGHGPPLRGESMRRQLHSLADDFAERVIPDRGRYVGRPASWALPRAVAAAGLAVVAVMLVRKITTR